MGNKIRVMKKQQKRRTPTSHKNLGRSGAWNLPRNAKNHNVSAVLLSRRLYVSCECADRRFSASSFAVQSQEHPPPPPWARAVSIYGRCSPSFTRTWDAVLRCMQIMKHTRWKRLNFGGRGNIKSSSFKKCSWWQHTKQDFQSGL